MAIAPEPVTPCVNTKELLQAFFKIYSRFNAKDVGVFNWKGELVSAGLVDGDISTTAVVKVGGSASGGVQTRRGEGRVGAGMEEF